MNMRSYVFLASLCGVFSLMQASPLPRRIVDMTYTFDENIPHFPTAKTFQTKLILNGTRKKGKSVVPWLQIEEYSSSVHLGTHIDAPAHFVKGGRTVENISLRHLVAPAAVVDTSARVSLNKEDMTTVRDLLDWEALTEQSLNGTILLLRTGWGRRYKDKAAYFGAEEDGDVENQRWPSIDPIAAQWLVDNRAIHGIGVEPISFDKGNVGPNFHAYPAHQILLGSGIFAIENVANLDQLPIYGAELHVLPMKIGKGSGAPVRMMATFPEVLFDLYSIEKKYSGKHVEM